MDADSKLTTAGNGLRDADFQHKPAHALAIALKHIHETADVLEGVTGKADRIDRGISATAEKLDVSSERLQHILIKLLGGQKQDGTVIPPAFDVIEMRAKAIAEVVVDDLHAYQRKVTGQMHAAAAQYLGDFNTCLEERKASCIAAVEDAERRMADLNKLLTPLQAEVAMLNKRLVATNSETPRARGPISRFFAKIGL